MSTGDQYEANGPFPVSTTLTSTADTVYAHVERTVHALCDAIMREVGNIDRGAGEAGRVKLLAEAVSLLSSWPQFNPMNAHEQYQALADYHVERALKAKLEPVPR